MYTSTNMTYMCSENDPVVILHNELRVAKSYLDFSGHTESDVLILFQEQENGLLGIIHLEPIHLQKREGGTVTHSHSLALATSPVLQQGILCSGFQF